ncbi:MAG: sigma-54-dependent transcriptional regulator [Candidatus Anammoxibacter sp.]
MRTILVVDDEKNIRLLVYQIFKEHYHVITVGSGEEAIKTVTTQTVDLVLLDQELPGKDGIETLSMIKQLDDRIPVIMFAAHGTIALSVKAMKLGASDFITKPFNFDEMSVVVAQAIRMKDLEDEVKQLHSELNEKYNIHNIIGKSENICKLLAIVGKSAKTKSNVLITGESGTGKELVARAIHAASTRKDKPFVAVSCPNLPLNLVESELFGHEKGSFTGATERKTGKFEIADNGTIFLDEIAEIELSIQSKLLRVIQEREFFRVGGTKPVKVNCRIIAATNKNLQVEMRNGKFREDLYFRLNVIPIVVPPLRERREDIPVLIDYFITILKKDIHCNTIKCSTKAVEILQAYNWPGNIRELRNIIERILSLCGETETITPHCLPEEIARNSVNNSANINPSSIESFSKAVSNVEKDLITQAYQRTGGKLVTAAKLLNMTPRILKYKMEKLGIGKVIKLADQYNAALG